MTKEYQKFRCANCEHEFISGATKPRCSKCFSTRINKIDAFTLEKELKPATEKKIEAQPIREPIVKAPKQEASSDFLDDLDF